MNAICWRNTIAIPMAMASYNFPIFFVDIQPWVSLCFSPFFYLHLKLTKVRRNLPELVIWFLNSMCCTGDRHAFYEPPCNHEAGWDHQRLRDIRWGLCYDQGTGREVILMACSLHVGSFRHPLYFSSPHSGWHPIPLVLGHVDLIVHRWPPITLISSGLIRIPQWINEGRLY